MKIFKLLTILAFLSTPALADDLPDAPVPKMIKSETARPPVIDKRFIAAIAVLAAAKTADGITSARNVGQGFIENNSLFGPHPSASRIAGMNAAYFASEVGEAYLLKRLGRRTRWLRFAWLVEPTWQTQQHIRFAARNASMRR